jgi:hypothetical protein
MFQHVLTHSTLTATMYPHSTETAAYTIPHCNVYSATIC